MEEFGILAFLVLVFGIGGLAGHGIGSVSMLESVKKDCDRYGAAYIKDVRYSCKPEPATQAERDSATHPTKDTKQ